MTVYNQQNPTLWFFFYLYLIKLFKLALSLLRDSLSLAYYHSTDDAISWTEVVSDVRDLRQDL